MANTSGRVGAGIFQEDFTRSQFHDSVNGGNFQIARKQEGYSLKYEKDGSSDGEERRLNWFIGSGRIGRSYLISIDDFLYQSPISYYTAGKAWAMSPGFQQKTAVDFTRPVEPSCLRCHATEIQPIPNTQNKYASPPFQVAGIACSRCHGPSNAHIAEMRAGNRRTKNLGIVNPAKLSADLRESICAQCHLTGAARIQRAHKRTEDYRPGLPLSDFIAVFTWEDAAAKAIEVTSHVEKLALSQCKKQSGERLWCGSCHDPHGEPEAAKRNAFYRARCLNCHQTSSCKKPMEERMVAGDYCAECHMPKGNVGMSQHMVYTDHSISRGSQPITDSTNEHRLIPFWRTAFAPRDLALAYASAAMTDPPIRRVALDLLVKIADTQPDDVPILVQLAQFYDRMGRKSDAAALYDRALKSDAHNLTSLINRGTLYAQQSNLTQAIEFWEHALALNPAISSVRMNLAVARFRSGNRELATSSLRTLLKYDPDNSEARQMLSELTKP